MDFLKAYAITILSLSAGLFLLYALAALIAYSSAKDSESVSLDEKLSDIRMAHNARKLDLLEVIRIKRIDVDYDDTDPSLKELWGLYFELDKEEKIMWDDHMRQLGLR